MTCFISIHITAIILSIFEAMCIALKSAARSQDAAIVDALPYLVQSLAQRINDLSAAWILAQDGMDDDTSGFEHVLFGINPGMKS